MTVINTNISATLAANAITRNDREMTTAMERLSTGKRINSAGDDAAGLAIAARMQSQVDGLDQAVRNANDGIAMLQVAEGAVVEISNMLSRMRELAIQAASGTYSATDLTALNLEFTQLRSELQRIANNTEWNGYNILNGNAGGTGVTDVAYQVGASSGQTMTAAFNTLYKSAAVVTSTAQDETGHDGSNEQAWGMSLVGDNVVAGDKLAFSITDSASNAVQVVINISAAMQVALEGGAGAVTVGNNTTDVAYIDGGRGTALTTVLNGVSGNGGIVVKFGANKAGANTADSIQIEGTANNQEFNMVGGATSVTVIRGEVTSLDKMDISTAANVPGVLRELDAIITNVSSGRAKYGAYINRLEHASDNLTNVAQNTDSSRSRIEDTDYAGETSELARTQIISQAATAMLAHANQAKQTVLALLQ